MNQKDLVKLVEDLRYVVQSGGGGIQQTGGGALGNAFLFLVNIIKGIFTLILYCVVLYILYIIIFKSYPRFAYDLATLSFFKKEKLDNYFTENDFMLSHYRFFLRKDSEFAGTNPFMLAQLIYNYKGSSSIERLVKNVDDHINEYYKAYKFNKRYQEAFKEYYLFHQILTPKPTTSTNPCEVEKCVEMYPEQLNDPSWQPPLCTAPLAEKMMSGTDQRPVSGQYIPCPPKTRYVIRHFEFYEKLIEMQKRIGALQTKHKEYFPSIAEMQYNDMKAGYPIYNRIVELRKRVDALSTESAKLVKAIDKNPVSWFVAIPSSVEDRSKIAVEVLNNFEGAINGSLYKAEDAKNLSDFSWYILEAFKQANYRDLKSTFESLLGTRSYETILVLTAYTNMPLKERKAARRTLLASHSNVNVTSGVLRFMNRHPIFCSIYFNTRQNVLAMDRALLYQNVIQTYRLLMATSKNGPALNLNDKLVMSQALQNLIFNGRHFKQWVNSIYILNMFLNTYKTTMIAQYEQQLLSNVKFFHSLFDPFKNELVHRRIVPYCRKVLSGKNWSKSFRNFAMLWKLLGTLIKRAKSMVSSSFKRGVSMPADEPPPQDNSPADSG